MKLAKFVMLIGIPGCGKSTWVNEQKGYIIVSPDSIRLELTGDITNQICNGKAWAIAFQRIQEALINGKNVILDATNVNTFYRRQFLQDLPKCKLQAKVFQVEPAEAYKRIKKDLDLGVVRSDVPESVVYKMHANLLDTLKPGVLESEGFTLI